MSIIIFDSYDKKILDENLEIVISYIYDLKLIDFNKPKVTNYYNTTYEFFDKLSKETSTIGVKGSFYTDYVNSLFGRIKYMTNSELYKLEKIQLFYFFFESPKPKTPKEEARWMLYDLLYKKSSLPIKVKVNMGDNSTALEDFKEQYYNYIIKKNNYLLVKEN